MMMIVGESLSWRKLVKMVGVVKNEWGQGWRGERYI